MLNYRLINYFDEYQIGEYVEKIPKKYIQKIIEEKVWSVPFDLANTDYQEYLKWLEEGNTPLPAEENI